jgi:anion-transporting  ArsA/GET3 family ATPase
MEKKKHIVAIIGTKGGVGKTKIATQVLPVALKDAEFELIEMDNNNKTAEALNKSELLNCKFKSVNMQASEEELENIFIDLIDDTSKRYIIDVGGGDDTIKFLKLLEENNLTSNTLFLIPYTPDFEAISNLFCTIEKVKKHDYMLILNNIFENKKEHMMFAYGDPEYGLGNIVEQIGRESFFFLPSTPLFSLAVSKHKATAWDVAEYARNLSKDELHESFKPLGKEERRMLLRKWKDAQKILEYFEGKEVKRLIEAIQKSMGLA